MDYQNITLSIRKDLLRRVKHIAIERQTSVSGLLAKLLEDLVQKEDAYRKAYEDHLEILETPLDLGTYGTISWRREDLHER
ncbi:MAG: CopG family transcriptional regulator [Firmicutes bacterium]|nr:CopG family transcriptional regulator [Bacillota bacterium]